MATLRAELEASWAKGKALDEAIAAWDKAEKTIEEEFKAGFHQGYVDIKRIVAID